MGANPKGSSCPSTSGRSGAPPAYAHAASHNISAHAFVLHGGCPSVYNHRICSPNNNSLCSTFIWVGSTGHHGLHSAVRSTSHHGVCSATVQQSDVSLRSGP